MPIIRHSFIRPGRPRRYRYRVGPRSTRRAQGCDTTRRVDILLFNILLHGIWPNDTAGSKDYTVCYYPTLLVTLLSIAPIEY